MLLIALHVDVDLDVGAGHRHGLVAPHQRHRRDPRLRRDDGVVERVVRPLLRGIAFPRGELLDGAHATLTQHVGPRPGRHQRHVLGLLELLPAARPPRARAALADLRRHRRDLAARDGDAVGETFVVVVEDVRQVVHQYAVGAVADGTARQRRARQTVPLEHPVHLGEPHLVAQLGAHLPLLVDGGRPLEQPGRDRSGSGVGDLVVDDDDGQVAAALDVAEQDLDPSTPAGVPFGRQHRTPDLVGTVPARLEGGAGALPGRAVGVDPHPRVGVGVHQPDADRLALRGRRLLPLLHSGVLGGRRQQIGVGGIEMDAVAAPRQRTGLEKHGGAVLRAVGGTHDVEDYVLT